MVPHHPLRRLGLRDLLGQLAEGRVQGGEDGVATSGQLGLQSGQGDEAGEPGESGLSTPEVGDGGARSYSAVLCRKEPARASKAPTAGYLIFMA